MVKPDKPLKIGEVARLLGVSTSEEVLSDFMAILASFSGRYYRLRSKREQRSLLDETKGKLDG